MTETKSQIKFVHIEAYQRIQRIELGTSGHTIERSRKNWLFVTW